MSGGTPYDISQLIGRQQNTVSLSEKMLIGNGTKLRPEPLQIILDKFKLSVVSSGVIDYATVSDMINGGSDIVVNNMYYVLDASAYSSLSSGWAIFKYQGGGVTNIGNYTLILAEEWFTAAYIDYDNADSGLTATKVKAAIDEMKQLITEVSTGTKWKTPDADLATTANITLSGEQTIDGTLTSGSRVLVKDQSTQSENGIYTTDSGAWTRTTDADSASELEGAVIQVAGGSVNADKTFRQTSISFTLNADPVVWLDVSGASIPDATESVKGKAEIANQSESETGGDATEGNRDHGRIMTARGVRWLIDFMELVDQDQLDLKLTITAAGDGHYSPADNDNTSGFFATLLTLAGNTALTIKTALDHIVSKIKTNIASINTINNTSLPSKMDKLASGNEEVALIDASGVAVRSGTALADIGGSGSGTPKEYQWTASGGQTDFEIGSSNAEEIHPDSQLVFVNNALQRANYSIIDGAKTKNTIQFDFGLSAGDIVYVYYWHAPAAPVIPVGSIVINTSNLQKQSNATSGNNANTGVVIEGQVNGVFEIIPGGPVKYGLTEDIYASSDGGVTAHSLGLGNIPDGATVYWNGNNNMLIGDLTTNHYIRVI